MPTMTTLKPKQASREVLEQLVFQLSAVQQINQLFAEFRDKVPRDSSALQRGDWRWDLTDNIITYSTEWKTLLGYRNCEIGNSPVEWLHRIHRDDLERVRCAITEYLSGKSACLEIEHRLLHRDETYRWVKVTGQAHRDPQGKIAFIVGDLSNISSSASSGTEETSLFSCQAGRYRTRPTLSSVFQFIETHYRDPISLREVAQAAGYSAAYLTHLVQQETGRTVNQWIVEYRMAEARLLLLKTDHPIYRIAIAVGYQSAEQFIRQFRQAHNVTPKSWRDTHRSSALTS